MKKLIFQIVVQLTSLSIVAQINGYVEYNYSVLHTIDYTTKSILQFDAEKSLFNILSKDIKNDSLISISSKNGNELNYFINKDSKKKPIYFTNKKDDLLISKIWKYGQYYFLNEEIPKIKWQIKPEYKKLSELLCQKAVGYFRGRTYTVWFTEAIPVSYGPWKLQGLPGLILEASDESKTFFYMATKIELNKTIDVKLQLTKDVIDLKTFITQIEPEMQEEIRRRSQAKLDRSITISSSSGVIRSSLKETTYEWEKEKN